MTQPKKKVPTRMSVKRKALILAIVVVSVLAFRVDGARAANTMTVTNISGLTVTVTVDIMETGEGWCEVANVHWDDGTQESVNAGDQKNISHTYASSGTYNIELRCDAASGGGWNDVGPIPVTVPSGGDTTPPTVTITSPTSASTYATASSTLTLSGTASDTVGVTQVTWSNNRGGSGTASGTTGWSAAGVVLQSGSNVLTVTARDAAGNTGTDQLTIIRDSTPPTVTITSPTSAAAYTTASPTLTLSGTASDNVEVLQVAWSNAATGGTGTAAGGAGWTAAGISLSSGSNPITVTASDSVGNTGNDQITVNYTPPSAAFSVTTSPSLTNIVPGRMNVFSLTYHARGSGDFRATSTQGRFVSPDGTELGTINREVRILIRNGMGLASELNITLQPHIITRALKSRANRILYQRTFTSAGNSADAELALQIVPSSVGPFSLVRMELNFTQATSRAVREKMPVRRSGRTTVPRNSKHLKAVADIAYDGGGLLRAQWKVDGQILGYVTQYCYPGVRRVSIQSPDVPGLPTYDTGQHSVELEVVDPAPPFNEPVIFYYVTQQEGEGVSQTLPLIAPEDLAVLPLSMEEGQGPEFSWEPLDEAYVYRFEIVPESSTGRETLPSVEGTGSPTPLPVLSAETQEGFYVLSQAEIGALQPGSEYSWHVQAYDGNDLVAASLYRGVRFEVSEFEGEDPRFEYLQIIETPSQEFETMEPLEMQLMEEEESSWFPFGPGIAYAAEWPGMVQMPGSMQIITPEEQEAPAGYLEVSEGMDVTIKAGLRNPAAQEKHNIRVEFLVDGQVVDVSFISVLAPGALAVVESTYQVQDAYSHTVQVRAMQGEGEETVLLSSLSGYMANQEGEQTQMPEEPPEEGYWIGEFNLKPTTITNSDPAHYSGSGTIEIPFMSEYPVEFSDLQIDEQQKRVTEGQIRLELGDTQLDITPLAVFLEAIIFGPEQARCEGHAEIPLIFTPDPLVLSLSSVIVHSDGLSGSLNPAEALSLDLVDPMDFTMTVLESSSVRLSGNTILDTVLDGVLSIPSTHLSTSGQAAEVEFSGLPVEQDGGVYGAASLSESKILGTVLNLSGEVVVDLTETASPGNKTAAWKGVYVDDGTIALQDPFSATMVQGVSGLFVYGGGVSGDVEVQDLTGQLDLGGGFTIRPRSLSLSFIGMALTDGTLGGSLHIPVLDVSQEFNMPITPQGEVEIVSASIPGSKHVEVEELFLDLVLNPSSSVSTIAIQGTEVRADLAVALSTTDYLALHDLVVNLVIKSDGTVGLSHVSGGDVSAWIPVSNALGELEFDGAFALSLEGVGFGAGSAYGGAFFGIRGKISIADNFAEGAVDILAQNGDIEVSEIRVDIRQPGAFRFDGWVEWFEDDPDFGNGFKGEMDLRVIETFSAGAELVVGHVSGFNYWRIHAAAGASGGIPLAPIPLSIYGFYGGAYYNMEAVQDEETFEVADYTPNKGKFGLMAGIQVGTLYDNGYTWHGRMGLEISNANSFTIALQGNSWILCDLSEEPSGRTMSANIQIEADPFVLSIDLGVKVNYEGIVKIPARGSDYARADLKFSADEWHIYFGTKESPISLKALFFKCSGYFAIDDKGIALGFKQALHAGGEWWIFYGYLNAGFQADVAVGYRPFFIYGEVAAWIDLRAGVHVDVWFWEGNIDIINAGAAANLGVRAPDPTRIWGSFSAHFSVLGGTVSGSFSMSFSWESSDGSVGGAGDEEIELPPPIVSTYPSDGGEDVPLAAKLIGRFPFTEGEVRTAYDLEYRVRYGLIRLWQISEYGARQPVSPRDRGVSEDAKSCYFYPRNLLEPDSTYRIEIHSFMEKRPADSQEPWQTDGETEFITHFTTGERAERWDSYVESTYPRPGQEYVYTLSDVDISFFANMPSDEPYKVGMYKKTGGGWQEVLASGSPLPRWGSNRQTIHCEAWDPDAGAKWLPNTDYQLRINTVVQDEEEGDWILGDEVYRLNFKTSAYENFSQMMDAHYPDPRIGWGLSEVPPVIFRVITFDTAEPINWKDVEEILVKPLPGWYGAPNRIGFSEVDVVRTVPFMISLAGNYFQLALSIPVHISSLINLEGAHHESWGTRHTIRHYVDYTNLFFTPDQAAVEAYLAENLSYALLVEDTFVIGETLSDEEKESLWNALPDEYIPGLYGVRITYRSIEESTDPLSWRRHQLQLEIPEEKLNRW